MKKSLIALAALAASGFAMAQSSVTLFGVLDTAYTAYNGAESVNTLGTSGNSSSRLGFRGVEDLGGGLKAQFWLEGAVSTDDGSGAGGGAAGPGFEFKRRSTLSLLGNFGEFRLGRSTTAAYDAISRYDNFGTVGIAGSQVNNGTTINDVRRSNMLGFYSSDFSGFKFAANYAFGENVGAANVRTGDYYGLSATYDNGPLSAGISYFDQGRTAVGGNERDGWGVGASYNFGVAKLAAAYQTAELSTVRSEGNFKREFDNYLVALSAPVGAAGEFKFSYNHYQTEESNTKLKAKQYSLGYVHNLSKRTALYGTYSYIKNSGAPAATLAAATPVITQYNLGNTAVGWTNSRRQTAMQLGVRHSF